MGGDTFQGLGSGQGLISDSGGVDAIEATGLASHGTPAGKFLRADGIGGTEWGDMSTFEYDHKDLSDSLAGKEKPDLIDIIRRHKKIVEQIDEMMIDLLAGAEMCSKVIMECLNNSKVKAIQLINYALHTLMEDMESVDKIEPEEKESNMEDLMGMLGAMPSNWQTGKQSVQVAPPPLVTHVGPQQQPAFTIGPGNISRTPVRNITGSGEPEFNFEGILGELTGSTKTSIGAANVDFASGD